MCPKKTNGAIDELVRTNHEHAWLIFPKRYTVREDVLCSPCPNIVVLLADQQGWGLSKERGKVEPRSTSLSFRQKTTNQLRNHFTGNLKSRTCFELICSRRQVCRFAEVSAVTRCHTETQVVPRSLANCNQNLHASHKQKTATWGGRTDLTRGTPPSS